MQGDIAFSSPMTWRWPAWKVDVRHVILAGLVGLSLLLYAFTTTRYGHTFATSDAYLYYTHARSWYFDGDCAYANDMLMAPGFEAAGEFVKVRSASGAVTNVHPCGWSLLALPFIALADGLTVAHNALFHANIPRNGYTPYYLAIVPLAHVLLGIVGLGAGYITLARYFPPRVAAAAVALVCLGTNVLYFVSIEPTMSHSATMAFVTMTVWVTDTIRHRGWTLARAVGLGVCCGMMMAVRYYSIAWVLVPLIMLGPALVLDCCHRRRGAWRRIGLLSLAVGVASLCLVPQVLVNLTIEEVFFFGRVTSVGPTWAHPRFGIEFLASSTGLLRLYPLVALCLAGFAWAIWVQRAAVLPVAMFFAFAAHATLYAYSYMPGYSRRYVCCFLVFAYGLAAILQWASRRPQRRLCVGVLVGALCVGNIALMVMVDRGLVSRRLIHQGHAELSGVASAAPPRTAQMGPPLWFGRRTSRADGHTSGNRIRGTVCG